MTNMMDLFDKSGIVSIGSRLRWLAETITSDAVEIYKLYGLDIKPKWFPVLYILYYGNDNTVTGIANSIGQSHPSVSMIVREMKASGLVNDAKSNNDRRNTTVSLTDKGKALRPLLQRVCDDVAKAVESMESPECRLWEALSGWEEKLSEKSLFNRVMEQKAAREIRKIEIVEYSPEYLHTFKRLNIMWINSHWSLEAHDLEVLSDPETSIISKGGHILVALVDGKPMGVVALCKMEHPDYDYEIAKLAVDPEARGTGIGDAIFREVINKARSLGAKRLFLESNTILKPAIGLYRKYGFTELKEYHTAYDRGDIQMELNLS